MDEDALVASAKAGVAACLANSVPDVNAEGRPWTQGLDDKALRLRVFYSEVPGSSLLRFKGVCDLDGFTPQFVQTAISDNVERLKWDSNMFGLDTIVLRGPGAAASAPELSATSDAGVRRVVLLRSATKRVGPVSAREFIDVTAICDDGFPGVPAGSVMSAGAGVPDADADARFPAAHGYVRGANSPGCGWLFERTPAGTRVHYVIHSDLKGWFVPMVINAVLTGSFVTFFGDVRRRLVALRDAGSVGGEEPAPATR